MKDTYVYVVEDIFFFLIILVAIIIIFSFKVIALFSLCTLLIFILSGNFFCLVIRDNRSTRQF